MVALRGRPSTASGDFKEGDRVGVRAWCSSVVFERGVRAWCSSVVFEREAQRARILIHTCEQHSINFNRITQIRATNTPSILIISLKYTANYTPSILIISLKYVNNTPSLLIISLKYLRTIPYRSLVSLYTQELQMHLYRRTYQHSNINEHNTGTHHQRRISARKNMHSQKPELAQTCEGCHG